MIDDPLNRTKVKRGSELPHAKLTESLVADIRRTIGEREQIKRDLRHMSNNALSRRYGVAKRTIDRISAGETWGHVDG